MIGRKTSLAGPDVRSAKGYTDWYLQHAETLQGDEDTDEYYSDDEYEEDAHALKSTRKSLVNVLRYYNHCFRKRAEDLVRKDMPSATVGDAQVTNEGVYFSVQSPQEPMNLAERAHTIDPETRSAFTHRQEQQYDAKSGALSTTYVSQFSYNVSAIVSDYLDAQWYGYNIFWSAAFFGLGVAMIANSWPKLGVFLSLQQASLLVGVALALIIYSGAPLRSRLGRVGIACLIAAAATALSGLLE